MIPETHESVLHHAQEDRRSEGWGIEVLQGENPGSDFRKSKKAKSSKWLKSDRKTLRNDAYTTNK